MKMDIWLILPYDIAWDKAHSMDKDLSYSTYTWYMRVYTKYILGLILNTLYTSAHLLTSFIIYTGIYAAEQPPSELVQVHFELEQS